MKLVYFDESGIGQLEQDPDLIVAGVMIDADRQYVGLSAYLEDMLDSFTPRGELRPKYLHAKDIFHGRGEFRGKVWEEARWPLLDELAKVPQVWDLPLFCSAIDRAGAAEELKLDGKHRDKNCYTIAAVTCILQVERYMRQHAPEEVGLITFEEVPRLQVRVHEIYNFLANPHPEFLNEASLECLPIERIIAKPMFQEKSETSILQIADYCAFAAKRALRQTSDHERLFAPIWPNVIDIKYGYSDGNPYVTTSPTHN